MEALVCLNESEENTGGGLVEALVCLNESTGGGLVEALVCLNESDDDTGGCLVEPW